MIGRGEQLTLTGYDDYLHLRLTDFAMDGEPPTKEIVNLITWEALSLSMVDLLPQAIGAMRATLQKAPDDDRA